jgi:hypothetical protein
MPSRSCWVRTGASRCYICPNVPSASRSGCTLIAVPLLDRVTLFTPRTCIRAYVRWKVRQKLHLIGQQLTYYVASRPSLAVLTVFEEAPAERDLEPTVYIYIYKSWPTANERPG